jgi:flagellar basal-body rod modification protein FlgD
MATIGATTSNVTAAVTNNATTNEVVKDTLASNFTTFLQLLTTQLKNQNPLEPLDTNQFTQQLVQFAQVEQQLKQNEQLAALLAIEKSAQSTTALAFVGAHVAVDGQTAALTEGQATWSFTVPKTITATVDVKNATGQTVYSGSFTMNPGQQTFQWDGRDASGVQWPDGAYTLSIVGKDASGQTVAVPTEVEGVVDSVDLTKSPPELSIGGAKYTVDKVKRVVRPNGSAVSAPQTVTTTSASASTATSKSKPDPTTAAMNAVYSLIEAVLR